ncbi:hypothetical protein K9U39_01635 [Rhodoblastus acidophilus]|uniref:Localization factor PodJL n=1 Tax=Candidatus Rhodoblastus alkanivorans TaxID=2954117 RepID=A0ABS9Z4P9_9HYPH|nr:hypothetical protein [Candidatus Rhodoblastus alkanivorans]MCI4679967.1 hypothetical protein [Candidatus Rhodoblastus alkanivorans]MCI4682350.1 hypothetical protein [Candidatus Rhodoblastus alkanivorans]MDI4639653.1 hypothetical protein [Rhodoblastus acidophilus]
MSKAAPWSIKGVDFDVRDAAKEAARRDGVSLGEWMNRAIADRAAEIGADAQAFDADERLEAVAAQLARLSREAREDATPQRRRGEAGRQESRQEHRLEPSQAARQETRAPSSRGGEGAAPEADDADGMEETARNRAPRRRAAPERRAGRVPSGEAFRPREADEIRPGRLGRESADAEALLEQAVAAFEEQAGRVESRAARAIANVAQMIEASEDERAGALAQVDARLAEIEHWLNRGDKEAIKPLRGMIASVHDRLGEIETRLARKERPADDKPLRGALERLESRIEAMSRQSEESADDSHLRRLDGRLGAILMRLDKVEAAPPGAGRDEQFTRLEKRFDTLMARLDRPAPAPAAPQAAGSALKGGVAGAIGEIAARQRDLESGARTTRPPAPQLATLLDERFEALARKFDTAAKGATPSPDKNQIDRLQNGISVLSDRIETMRQEFAASGAHSRAELEQFARELSRRVDVALAAPQAAGLNGLEELRRDIAALSRDVAEAPPRAAAAGLEKAMRDLADRVDASRDAMIQAAEARRDPAPSAQIEALTAQVAALGRQLSDAAPRAAAAAVQEAAREWTARLEEARDAMVRAVETRGEPAPSAQIEALTAQVMAMGRDLAAGAPRAAAAAIEQATRELAARVDEARDAMIRAAAIRPEPTSSAEIDALGEQVSAMSRALADLAPRSQVASLENAVRALTGRIERSREEGIREAVLAPIESLAADVRRALTEAGASANFDGVSRQLREVEDKIENLRHDGGADRADFLQVYDQSEQIRAMLAEAIDKIAPIERLENQVGALGVRLEEVARQTREAGAAQVALPWGEIESRLNDLAMRIDRAGFDRAQPQTPVDDARFDDLARRLDFLQETLAARLDDAQNAPLDQAPAQSLEPLLRSLSEKLSAEPAPQIGPGAMEALECRIAEISHRLEQGDSEAERRLHRAIEELSDRLDSLRDPEREDRNAREITDLREKTEASDRRAQQTLSAVHETLEKVVDRLAMLEEDVIDARGAAEAAARAPAAADVERVAVDPDDFLMEPGAGRPGEAKAGRAAQLPRAAEMDDHEPDLGLDEPRSANRPDAKSGQSSYIDIARRALAARVAAESAENQEKDTRRRLAAATPPKASTMPPKAAATAPKAAARARFVRPLAAGEKAASRRLPAVLLTAVSVLSLGAYEAYRLFDTPAPPMQAVSAAGAEKTHDAGRAPAPVPPAEKTGEAAPAAPASPAAPAASPTAPLNSAPVLPGNVVAPKSENGASLPDPLATGSIGSGPNTIAAVEAGARALAQKERAEKGDAAAQYDFAIRLAEGRGVQQDQAAAVGWFEKAAAKGLPQAQYRLGAIYEKGIAAARDPKKAAFYYEKAANQGHVRAMHNLGVVLAEGVDGKPDYAAAAQWFRRAAEYGVRDSQFNLAILYARGMGVPQDLGQSYVWFAIAAMQGDQGAAKKRDELGERLNAAALQQAKKQVASFHAKTPSAAVNNPPAAAPDASASASRKSSAVRRI